MDTKTVLENTKDAMNKSCDFCKSQLANVRTGRATPSLVDNLKADYYGAPTAISQMASVSVPDARTIMIQPWDRTTLKAIEKAIQAADLGFNPQNDGINIRIPVPPLTEERRKEFVKVCKKYAEEGKIAVRNVRRDQLEVVKKLEKDKTISEDDKKRAEEEIQKLTDEYVKKIDVFLVAKEKELTED